MTPDEQNKRIAEELKKWLRTSERKQLILSLLYDLDLMPEQIRDAKSEWQMLSVIAHFKSALETENPASRGSA